MREPCPHLAAIDVETGEFLTVCANVLQSFVVELWGRGGGGWKGRRREEEEEGRGGRRRMEEEGGGGGGWVEEVLGVGVGCERRLTQRSGSPLCST